MNAKFTKGPWRVEHLHSQISWPFIVSEKGGIAKTDMSITERNSVPYDEAQANARLISQAPAMFEALQGCLDCMVPTGQDTRTDRAMKEVRAIIARVLGEPCEPQFEQWRDKNLEVLRSLYVQNHKLARGKYQSFPDFCRQQWEERKEKVKIV